MASPKLAAPLPAAANSKRRCDLTLVPHATERWEWELFAKESLEAAEQRTASTGAEQEECLREAQQEGARAPLEPQVRQQEFLQRQVWNPGLSAFPLR